jgi:DNA-binding winged helix-turn-helix (wHTH) protein
MNTKAYPEPVLWRKSPLPHHATWWSPDNTLMVRRQPIPAAVEATLEFGRFRVLLRRRQLLGDSGPIELGTRAFDLLLVLLEANGLLVTKGELLSRVWPGIVVAEDNLKVHVSALRRALGEDRDFIRTEFGRGYRFTAVVHSTVVQKYFCRRNVRCRSRSDRKLFPSAACQRSLDGLRALKSDWSRP